MPQFHLLSFEGPDPYASAGGIASRISGLAQSLAGRGFETHLWFVGDPARPGHETVGDLHLHRWCQWLSDHHPLGVYDGEDEKCGDYARSLPPWMLEAVLGPHLERGGDAVVLAEEWHTVDAVLHLDQLLRQRGWRDRVSMFWNANNVFGFDRIPWGRLDRAAQITTVSRYMKQWMQPLGVDPVVIPNGISSDSFDLPERAALAAFARRHRKRTVLAKVARFDPDKRWLAAVEIVAELKRRGERPLLIARGGLEAHGMEVAAAIRAAGLRLAHRRAEGPGVEELLRALEGLDDVDVVNLRSPLDPLTRKLLYRGADAVLANSGHEPFGLVGLEAMAVGAVACTGCSGEDYAVAGHNALVLQTADAGEFVGLFGRLRSTPGALPSIRRAGRQTARQFRWTEVLDRVLLPRIELLRAAMV